MEKIILIILGIILIVFNFAPAWGYAIFVAGILAIILDPPHPDEDDYYN